MEKKIEWSEKSLESLDSILNYLEFKFGINTSIDLLAEIEKVLELLSLYPKLGKHEYGNIRSLIILKKTTLIYSINEEMIRLLNFFDNRQNPDYRFDFSH